MELQFSEFKYPEELEKQRELFVECFPETIGTSLVTMEHYKWKFKSFPASGLEPKSYEYTAYLDGDIIGYYAAIPYEYVIQNKIVTSAMVCDVMTGIKARGKGVFTKLGIYSTNKFKTEGLAFSTGYPIRPEVIPGHKKAGWEFPFQIPMYGKFLKMNTFLKTRNKEFITPIANLVISVYNGLLSISVNNSKLLIVEKYASTNIDDIKGLDEFFFEWKKQNPIVLNKSKKFLGWRLGAPEKNYELIVLRNKKDYKIVGYTVFRNIEKEGVQCLGILDFCLLKNSLKLSQFLLKQIDHAAKKSNIELILMMMTKSKAINYKIALSGYLKTPYPFAFIIKQYDDSLNSKYLTDESNWSLMWIDSDDL
jgi:hypothetical protein